MLLCDVCGRLSVLRFVISTLLGILPATSAVSKKGCWEWSRLSFAARIANMTEDQYHEGCGETAPNRASLGAVTLAIL